MFEEYRALAYRKAIWEKVGQVLKNYFPEDLEEGDHVILCDEVAFKDRQVTREAIEDVLEEVANIVREASDSLASFEMVRKANEQGTVEAKTQRSRSVGKSTRRKTRKG